MWGAVQCYDPSSVNVNEGGWSVAFEYLASKSYSQTPSRTALKAAGMPELVSTYTTTMRKFVLKYIMILSKALISDFDVLNLFLQYMILIIEADWVKCVALYAGTKDAPCAIQ